MKWKNIVMPFIALLLGCTNPAESAFRERLKRELVDPDSAQFRETELSPNFDCLQGEVNSRNRMGGCVGFKKFFVNKSEVIISKDDIGLDVTHAFLSCFRY